MSDKVEAEERQLFEMFTSRERLDYRLDHEGRYASAETFDAFKFFRIGLWSPKISPSLADREALVQHMVNRFLQWRLPENFNPDGGISFKKAINEQLPTWPQKNEPTGTNLLDATQAEEMVRYMLSESPSESAPAPEGATREKIAEEIYDLFGMVTQMHPADGRDKAYSKSDREELLKILAKLPAPEGMGRDVKICTCSHRQERHNKSGCQDCTSCEFFVSAHPTSESGTEDSRPYPDATVMRSRLQLLSFLITGNDYAFFSANPAIQESLKCYSERVIEDWQAKAESGRVEER